MSVANILEKSSFRTTAIAGGFPVDVNFVYERVDNQVTVSVRANAAQFIVCTDAASITAAQMGCVGTLLARDGGIIGQTICFTVPVTIGATESITTGFVTLSAAGALHFRRVKYLTGAAAGNEALPDPIVDLAALSRIYNCSLHYVLPINPSL